MDALATAPFDVVGDVLLCIANFLKRRSRFGRFANRATSLRRYESVQVPRVLLSELHDGVRAPSGQDHMIVTLIFLFALKLLARQDNKIARRRRLHAQMSQHVHNLRRVIMLMRGDMNEHIHDGGQK